MKRSGLKIKSKVFIYDLLRIGLASVLDASNGERQQTGVDTSPGTFCQ